MFTNSAFLQYPLIVHSSWIGYTFRNTTRQNKFFRFLLFLHWRSQDVEEQMFFLIRFKFTTGRLIGNFSNVWKDILNDATFALLYGCAGYLELFWIHFKRRKPEVGKYPLYLLLLNCRLIALSYNKRNLKIISSSQWSICCYWRSRRYREKAKT